MTNTHQTISIAKSNKFIYASANTCLGANSNPAQNKPQASYSHPNTVTHSSRAWFRDDSTTPSMGDPGAESDVLPLPLPQAQSQYHDGELLAAALGEGEEATGRRSEAVGSGKKSADA